MTTYQHPETIRGKDGIYRCTRCGAASARETALALLPCKGEAEPEVAERRPAGVVIESASEPPLPNLGTLWAPPGDYSSIDSRGSNVLVFSRFYDGHYNWRNLGTGLESMGQMALPGDGLAPGVSTFGAYMMVSPEMMTSAPSTEIATVVEGRLKNTLMEGMRKEHSYPVDAVSIEDIETTSGTRYDASVLGVRLPEHFRVDLISRHRLEIAQPRLSPR